MRMVDNCASDEKKWVGLVSPVKEMRKMEWVVEEGGEGGEEEQEEIEEITDSDDKSFTISLPTDFSFDSNFFSFKQHSTVCPALSVLFGSTKSKMGAMLPRHEWFVCANTALTMRWIGNRTCEKKEEMTGEGSGVKMGEIGAGRKGGGGREEERREG